MTAVKTPREPLRVTEARAEKFAHIEQMDTSSLLYAINDEDAKVAQAVRKAVPALTSTANAAARGIADGGRLIYVGAGTSGRLGVMDAAECPPTFGVDGSTVQGHIAGGFDALIKAAEGAEDDGDAGAALIQSLDVTRLDTVVGISAAGGARYVVRAIEEARSRGAFTAALTSNEHTPLAGAADVAIEILTGPEVIAGSTRMKCGTAQKMALNMLSTAVMVKLGYAKGGVMSNLRATNEKLTERGVRIIAQSAGISEAEAARRLGACGGDVGAALKLGEE